MSAIGFGIGAVPEIRLVALLFWRTEPPHFLLLSSSKGSFLHHENSPKDFNFWFWLFRFIALVYEEIEGCPFPGIVQIKRIHFKGGLSSGWLCIAILNFHSPQTALLWILPIAVTIFRPKSFGSDNLSSHSVKNTSAKCSLKKERKNALHWILLSSNIHSIIISREGLNLILSTPLAHL